MNSTTRRGVYLVPSMFTLANMALGFYAIVAGFNEEYVHGATAIIVAHVMDMFDGRVARWTKTTSRFGIEFDSLADWISFGIAPALMIYNLALEHYGKWGFLLAFFFIVCGSLRLARFNIKAHDNSEASNYFVGLPIPAAGGMIAVFVLLYTLWAEGRTAKTFKILMNEIPILYQVVPLIVFVLSLLMVSNVRYTSFKKMNLLRPRSLRALMLLLFGGFMIYAYPNNTIFILYAVYILWGLADYMWRAWRFKRTEAKTWNA
jgi:CDP-diacylglycerol--serine O-phosphatidyltransferase